MQNEESLNAIESQRNHNFTRLDENGINLSSLDKFERFISTDGVLDRDSLIIRCTISDGCVQIKTIVARNRSKWRLRNRFEPFINRISKKLAKPVDFFLLVSDTLYISDAAREQFIEMTGSIPFLRCDWLEDDEISESSIIIPDFRLIDNSYASEFRAVSEAADTIAFEERIPVIKWRGTLSGPGYPDIYNCKQFPRYHLLMQASAHPDFVDAKLITYENFVESDAASALQKRLDTLLGGLVPKMKPEEFVSNRYLLAVDGVTAPWKTVPLRLATGSVLLMQHRWKQFFSPGLREWEHYVPLKDDMSDIGERYRWLESHPERASAIAKAGKRFADDIMRPEQIEDFFIAIMNRCGSLLT